MFDQVLEIFDEAAKKVVLSIYPNYERIAADIKVLYPVKFHRTLNAFFETRFASVSCRLLRS